MEEILGIVNNNTFTSVDSYKVLMVTKVRMVEARPPESDLIDLSIYEGKAIMVNCDSNDGGTLWGSQIIEEGGPILSALVKKIFKDKKDC